MRDIALTDGVGVVQGVVLVNRGSNARTGAGGAYLQITIGLADCQRATRHDKHGLLTGIAAADIGPADGNAGASESGREGTALDGDFAGDVSRGGIFSAGEIELADVDQLLCSDGGGAASIVVVRGIGLEIGVVHGIEDHAVGREVGEALPQPDVIVRGRDGIAGPVIAVEPTGIGGAGIVGAGKSGAGGEQEGGRHQDARGGLHHVQVPLPPENQNRAGGWPDNGHHKNVGRDGCITRSAGRCPGARLSQI